ncbi:MAG: polyamine aminopropyltransferase [Pseudomonadota bacterium]
MTTTDWFYEECREDGTRLGIQITAKLYEEQTPWQKIEIYGTTHYGNLMVIDGFVMLSTRENFVYHEMMTHPALFAHDDPRQVLIIGGGDCGSLREVLQHDSIERAFQVDIDEAVTRASEKYFPELCVSNADPRADLRFEDGIDWIKRADGSSLDIIIVDSTDPIGPGEILFKQEFYAECHRVLRDGGILVQQSESFLLHLHSIIQPMYQAMHGAGFEQVRSVQYPVRVYPGGWWSSTLAGKKKSLSDFREADATSKNFETRYYHKDLHRASFTLPVFVNDALS